MATGKKGTKMDPKLVAGKQEHEVKYAAKKSGGTAEDVRAAVKKVGSSRAKVEAELEKSKS